MTNTDATRSENDDRESAPEYEQLGDAGNPFTGDSSTASTEDTPDIDNAPAAQGDEADDDQNPPLPDWGPTDGVHGVDSPATS